jgi:hypothetical protein
MASDCRPPSAPGASQIANYLWDVTTPGVPELALERDGGKALLRRYLHGADVINLGGTPERAATAVMVEEDTGQKGTERDRRPSLVGFLSASSVPIVVAGVFGYAVGGIGVGVIAGLAVFGAFMFGYFAPPLAPASESSVPRFFRRVFGRRRDPRH